MKWNLADSQSGTPSMGQVTVCPTRTGETLTTFDLRTWLTLQYLWWNSPDRQVRRPIPATLGTIGRTMSHSKGLPSKEVLERSLSRLSQVTLEWRDSFRIPSPHHKDGRIEKDTVSFTLLENTGSDTEPDKTNQQRRADQTTMLQGPRGSKNIGYRFHERIEKNLLHHCTQFIDFITVVRLRSELGISLYVLLNGILANRTAWQRDVWKLFYEDLCFPTRYYRDAELRKILKNPMKELQGKPLVQGSLHLVIKTDILEESASLILECNGKSHAMAPKVVVTR
jgi:hypothetical protein